MKTTITSTLTLLACLCVVSSAYADEDLRGEARPGWTLSLGIGGSRLNLDEADAENLFASGPVEIEELGTGGSIQVGYAFTRSFELQFRFVGSEHATNLKDRELIFAQAQLDAVVMLHEEGAIRPYLAGGIGGGVLGLVEDEEDVDTLVGGSVDMGGGVEIHLSRRWAVSFDYRFSVQNFEEEQLSGSAGDETRDIDLSSSAHMLGTRVTFSF